MTIANNIVSLSLRNSGVTGVGQVPLAADTADAFTILNAWINEINLERANMVNREVCPTFPDMTTDVPFWTSYEHVLLTSMAVRLREIYSLPPVDLDVKLAVSALTAFNAINLQQQAPPTVAADDTTGFGIIFLALRAAGRIHDAQGALETSQDVTDAHSILNEMLDEWNRERAVRVIPGSLPTISNLSSPVTLSTGQRNAIVLNLAVRLRDWFGAEVSKTLLERADRALQLIQAINQQQTAPIHAGVPSTVQQLVFLALRMAGRITDEQSVADASKDANDALSLFSMMIAQWQRQRWITWPTSPLSISMSDPLTVSDQSLEALVSNLAARIVISSGQPLSEFLSAEAGISLNTLRNQQMAEPLHAGVPSTAQGVIFLALRMAGRITDTQSVADDSKDVNDAFSLLVMMLAQWQRKRWLLWNEQQASVVSTGANWYTIGPGQDFDVARPDKIHAAWCRLQQFSYSIPGDNPLAEQLPFLLGANPLTVTHNPVDLPLQIIEAREDWATIAIKDLRSIPSAVFYDSAWPTGRLYFWPVPIAAQYELHIIVKASLPAYASVNDDLGLPPEYLDAVVSNLACKIALASGGQVSPLLLAEARASLNTIKLANSQIPLLSMPAFLSGHRGDASSWVGRGLDRAWTVGGTSVLG